MNTIWVSLVGMLIGGGVGAIMALLTKTYYVPILVPVAMGAAVGMPVAFFLHYFRMERPVKAVIVVALAWATCVVAFHWVEYRIVFVGEIQKVFDATREVDGGPPFTDEDALQKTHEILVQETGHPGFRGFLLYRGRAGLEMRVLQKKVLQPAWAFGVWALDLLVLLIVMLRIGLGVVRRLNDATNTVEAQ